jgi:hypothetical protein
MQTAFVNVELEGDAMRHRHSPLMSHARSGCSVCTMSGMWLRQSVTLQEKSSLSVTGSGSGREMIGMAPPSPIVAGGHMDLPECGISHRFPSFALH